MKEVKEEGNLMGKRKRENREIKKQRDERKQEGRALERKKRETKTKQRMREGKGERWD